MPLVLLTAVLTVVAVLVSWNIDLRPKEYFAWLLVLQTSVFGVFTALDLIFFFLFWELELIPMFLLISTWGSGNRNYSAMKFVLYTVFGSAFMLAGFLVLGSAADTFDIRELRTAELGAAILPAQAIFSFILIAFAIKLPVFPLHTWLPDAHTDAPTAVSVLLAGVLLKMGGYGILRLLFTLMPEVGADADLALAIIGAVSIVYGAIVTIRQTDLKRLIAYSSVSHMGFVLLGVSALGVDRHERRGAAAGHPRPDHRHAVRDGRADLRPHAHAPDRRDARVNPLHAAARRGDGLRRAGRAGLPALAGFVAEITIFLGAFGQHEAPRARLAARRAARGRLHPLGAATLDLRPARRKMGRPDRLQHWTEFAAIGALTALIVLLGVYPRLVMDLLRAGRGADRRAA